MKTPNLILTHAIGNANVRGVLKGFNEANMLHEYYTAFACFESELLYSMAKGPLSEFKRRSYDESLKRLTTTHPYKELGRLIATKLNWKNLIQHEIGRYSIDRVLNELDESLAKRILKNKYPNINGVYAYEDGAMEAFKAAKSKQIKCLYDLPIGYWRAARELMKIEIEKQPEWAATITGFNDSHLKLNRKDQELELADEIFVASSFTAKTLQHYPGQLSDIHVVPYGFPTPGTPKQYDYSKNRKLKVLFVGGLSQRKGIAYLFQAVKQLQSAVELTVVGNTTGVECSALDQALSNCHYIPSLPHAQILEQMKQADVLIFPSLFEGFGLVITEAMSQGTPVITTDRTAGPDIIQHNHNGWIVEAGSTNAIVECLEHIIQEPDTLSAAGHNAYQTANNRPWSAYSSDMGKLLLNIYNSVEVNIE